MKDLTLLSAIMPAMFVFAVFNMLYLLKFCSKHLKLSKINFSKQYKIEDNRGETSEQHLRTA